MTESDLKCVFPGPQISGVFACSQGRQVVRRGGAEIACGSEQAQRHCAQLFESLKAGALAHMQLEDDLLSLPHSVLLKVQYGGLLGLQQLIGDDSGSVADIHGLLDRLQERYGELDNVPCADVAPKIAAFKMRRRGKS